MSYDIGYECANLGTVASICLSTGCNGRCCQPSATERTILWFTRTGNVIPFCSVVWLSIFFFPKIFARVLCVLAVATRLLLLLLLLLLLFLHPFNGLFSTTTWVSWYQKGKTILDLNEARVVHGASDQDRVQTVCTSLQTDNHTNTSSLNFHTPDALTDAQPTVSKHWRQIATRLLLAFGSCLLYKYAPCRSCCCRCCCRYSCSFSSLSS